MIEAERLRVLEEYEILDTLPEKEFDDIVELASRIVQNAQIILDDTLARFSEAQKTAHIGNWDYNVRTKAL